MISPPKPLLCGWLHAIGAVAALITTIILLIETAGDRPRFLSLLVFGLSMILLYVVRAVASFFTLRLPRWVLILLYIGMGWIALFLLPHMVRVISLQPVLLLLTGGLLYTVGALIYAFRWPNPLPHIFGFHELFHLLVIAGTVAITATI